MVRLRWFLALGAGVCFTCVSVVFARLWVGYWTHGFLLWNLFLALIPVGLALVAASVGKRHGMSLPLVLLLVLWLLFLPNAPYLLTDIVHLGWGGHALPRIADGLVLALAGVTGLLAAVLSVSLVREIVRSRFGVSASRFLMILVFPLASVGVYLGRVVRLNSWDALLEPSSVAGTVWSGLRDPLAHSHSLVGVAAFAGFLVAAYTCYERLNASRRLHR